MKAVSHCEIVTQSHNAVEKQYNSTTSHQSKANCVGATPRCRAHHGNGAHPVAYHHIHHDRHSAICYVSQALYHRWGSTLPASVTNILLVTKYDSLRDHSYCPGYHRTSAGRSRHAQDVTPTHAREGRQDMHKTTYINKLNALADDKPKSLSWINYMLTIWRNNPTECKFWCHSGSFRHHPRRLESAAPSSQIAVKPRVKIIQTGTKSVCIQGIPSMLLRDELDLEEWPRILS